MSVEKKKLPIRIIFTIFAIKKLDFVQKLSNTSYGRIFSGYFPDGVRYVFKRNRGIWYDSN